MTDSTSGGGVRSDIEALFDEAKQALVEAGLAIRQQNLPDPVIFIARPKRSREFLAEHAPEMIAHGDGYAIVCGVYPEAKAKEIFDSHPAADAESWIRATNDKDSLSFLVIAIGDGWIAPTRAMLVREGQVGSA